LYGAALLMTLLSPAQADAQGFVGETQCANPTCHGAVVDPAKAPWKWARSQWLDQSVDRHSRAYKTLEVPLSKQIADYMGISATQSDKCLICHAPKADRAAKSSYKVSEGVTCEHCHGPAEKWLVPHKAVKEWRGRTGEYASLGFTDLNNFRVRADKCAECHTEIDHEIVAGGHPPLQFEMVAYAQVMKHWDDSEEHPGFSPDPTLWALGQVVGLRRAAAAIATRAGGNNYQSLGQFHGFTDANCYKCHHKLVVDVSRQAQGHVDMLEIITGAIAPGAKGTLTGQWSGVMGAIGSSAPATQQKATALANWLKELEGTVAGTRINQASTKAILNQILSSGNTLGVLREFSHSRVPGGNAERVVNVDLPWWYTTGGREQTALAIQALTPPAFTPEAQQKDLKAMQAPILKILPELKQLNAAIDRENQDPAKFNAALAAIRAKLF
jgi:hypothetical protein